MTYFSSLIVVFQLLILTFLMIFYFSIFIFLFSLIFYFYFYFYIFYSLIFYFHFYFYIFIFLLIFLYSHKCCAVYGTLWEAKKMIIHKLQGYFFNTLSFGFFMTRLGKPSGVNNQSGPVSMRPSWVSLGDSTQDVVVQGVRTLNVARFSRRISLTHTTEHTYTTHVLNLTHPLILL